LGGQRDTYDRVEEWARQQQMARNTSHTNASEEPGWSQKHLRDPVVQGYVHHQGDRNFSEEHPGGSYGQNAVQQQPRINLPPLAKPPRLAAASQAEAAHNVQNRVVDDGSHSHTSTPPTPQVIGLESASNSVKQGLVHNSKSSAFTYPSQKQHQSEPDTMRSRIQSRPPLTQVVDLNSPLLNTSLVPTRLFEEQPETVNHYTVSGNADLVARIDGDTELKKLMPSSSHGRSATGNLGYGSEVVTGMSITDTAANKQVIYFLYCVSPPD